MKKIFGRKRNNNRTQPVEVISKQKTHFISKYLYSHVCPILITLLLSMAIWWNTNFFTPDTYINSGDTMFPFNPFDFLKRTFYSWNDDGLGLPNYWPTFFPHGLFAYLLSIVGTPLWIINRLWVVIPTAMIGWGVYYLYTSLFTGKYSKIAGTISAVFAMLTPSFEINPIAIQLPIGGFALLLGSLIRGINSGKPSIKYAILTSLGVMLLATSPRYLYIGIIVALLYLIIFFCLNRSQCSFKTVKFLMISVVLTLLINMFWIAPATYFYFSGISKLDALYKIMPSGYGTGLDLLNQYTGWTSLSYTFRLLNSNPDWPAYSYMTSQFIALFSFIMPVYAFFSLIMLKKQKNLYIIAIIALFLLFFASAMHYSWSSEIYLFLWRQLPGFSMFKSPVFFIMVLGIFYALLTGATTQGLLLKIDSLNIHFTTKKVKTSIKIFLLLTLLILMSVVYGGSLLIGISPVEGEYWGRTIYGNHVPSANIPQEYFDFGTYLSKNMPEGYRVLNLPWSYGGYPAYSWWHYYNMPEVLSTILPFPVIGSSYSPGDREQYILNLLRKGDGLSTSFAARLIGELNIKYVVVHKDYFPIPGVIAEPNKSSNLYILALSNSKDFREVLKNNYFSVYEVNRSLVVPPVVVKLPRSEEISKNFSLMTFTGLNYLYIPQSASLSPDKSITLTAWIHPFKVEKDQGIVSKWASSGGSDDNYVMFLDKIGNMGFALNFEGRDYIPSVKGNLRNNAWYFLAVVYNSAEGQTFYINGIPSGITTFTGVISSSDTPLLIGAHSGNSPNAFFEGFIENVQIYNQSLSSQQIFKLYQNGIEGEPFRNQGLVGWWLIQNISGNVVKDLSGHNNDATLKGDIVWNNMSKFVYRPIQLVEFEGIDTIYDFKRTSPSKYRVNINTTSPFYLILKQGFSEDWAAYVNGNKADSHFESNFNMNAWYINQTGALEINLLYQPQMIAETSLFVSIISLMILFLILFISRFRPSIIARCTTSITNVFKPIYILILKRSRSIIVSCAKSITNFFAPIYILILKRFNWNIPAWLGYSIILFIALILLFVYVPYKGLITIGDQVFPFYPATRFYQSIFTWYVYGDGCQNVVAINHFLSYSLTALLDFIGLPLWLTNRVILFGPWMLLGISTYYLLGIFYPEKFFPRIIGGLFSILNPFSMSWIGAGPSIAFSSAALVAALAFSIKSIESNSPKYVILASLASVVLFLDARFFLMCWMLILLYVLTDVFIRKDKKIAKGKVRIVFKIALLSLLLNSFFIIPNVYNNLSSGVSGIFGKMNPLEVIIGQQPWQSLWWSARLISGGGMQSALMGTGWTEYTYYTTILSSIVGFVIILISYLPLILKVNRKFGSTSDHHLIYFTAVAIVSTILSTGIHYDDKFYLWLFYSFSPLTPILFQNPMFFQLSLMLSYSYLLGTIICIPRSKTVKAIIFGFLLLLIIINAFPLLNGAFIKTLKPVEVPDDYYQLNNHLKDLQTYYGTYNVLVLPEQKDYSKFSWGDKLSGMHDPIDDFSPMYMYVKTSGTRPATGALRLVYDSFSANDLGTASNLLQSLGIKYVVIHKDLVGNDVTGLTNVLDKSKYFNKSFDSQYLMVYIVNDTPLPRVYAAPKDANLSKIFYRHSISLRNITEVYKVVNYHITNDGYIRFADNSSGYVISKIDFGFPLQEATLDTSNIYIDGSSNYSVWISSDDSNYELLSYHTGYGVKNSDAIPSKYQGNNTIFIKIKQENYYILPSLSVSAILSTNNSIYNLYDDKYITGRTHDTGNYIFLIKPDATESTENNLKVERINPTKYIVNVKTSDPFFLILSENYDPNWRAYSGNVGFTHVLLKKPYTPNFAYGYTNAWFIDPKEIDKDGNGEFAITLYFWYQSLFYISLITSCLIFLGCVIIWVRKTSRFKNPIDFKQWINRIQPR